MMKTAVPMFDLEALEVERPPDDTKQIQCETEAQAKRQFGDLVGAIADPLIIHSSPWADIIPEWLRAQVKMDRLILLMKHEETATDAEALAYLMPATMDAPMQHHWSQIYLYLATKVCEAAGKKIPGDVRVDRLTSDESRYLGDLKSYIYQKRLTLRPKEPRAKKPDPEPEAPRMEAAPLFELFQN